MRHIFEHRVRVVRGGPYTFRPYARNVGRSLRQAWWGSPLEPLARQLHLDWLQHLQTGNRTACVR